MMMETPYIDSLNIQASQQEPYQRSIHALACQHLPPSSPWNPNHWAYVAEGGKHAIFRYSGTDQSFSGHVLRIAKYDMANASSSYSGKTSSVSTPRTCKVIELMEESAFPSQTFQRKIVQPLLGHRYLDLARVICLPATCCAQLYHGTIASGSIPSSRLPSWSAERYAPKDSRAIINNSVGIQNEVVIKATLLCDHTHLPNHPRISAPAAPMLINIFGHKPTTVLSVEIKPKAGYITASPLVLPFHRCKFYRTRYSMQQELMKKGYVQKGWRRIDGVRGNHHEAFIPSNYSPLDLFSGNIVRIQQALRDLSSNMQNNFRVWCNGKQIFGEYDDVSQNECQNIFEDIFHPSSANNYKKEPLPDPKSTLLDVISNVVSKVLHRESLLSNILSMQQLDVLDGDGATMVYERLVHLCGGSNVEAEQILDEAVLISRDGLSIAQQSSSSDSHIHQDSSPYATPACDTLYALMNEIANFQTYLRRWIQEGSIPDEKVLNASHMECVECVNCLTKEACVYLLQNWLLSLALCDVSFFVTFRFLTDIERAVMEEFQSCDHGGITLCSIQDGTSSAPRLMAVHYEVKIVDCDPKPAKKLRERGVAESKFQFIAL